MDFEKEIQELHHRVKKLEYPKGFPKYSEIEPFKKPLAISASDNTPCTDNLEVKLQKLAAYFEKFYFSGKADTYARAAQKVRELLCTPEQQGAPEKWIVEFLCCGRWVQSGNPLTFKEFTSEAEARRALDNTLTMGLKYRVRQIY